jgi:hypothetical protein
MSKARDLADNASTTAADKTKIDGIEALADVTDVTNVTDSGALMDSELANVAAVKALNQGLATTDSPTFAAVNATTFTGAGSGITSLTAANLTGALPAINGSGITSLTAANLTGALPAIDGSALTGVSGSTTAGAVGTYAFLFEVAGNVTGKNTTRAGSGLRYANAMTDLTQSWAGYSPTSASGTWRCMGYTGRYNNRTTNVASYPGTRITLWLRIS